MHEPTRSRFEAELAAALDAYADGAPVLVDPMAVARAAAADPRAGRLASLHRAWWTARPALLLAALLALLIAALLASGAVQRMSPPPQPVRAVVSDGVTAWIVGAGRTIEAQGMPNLPRRAGGCGWAIGGTDVFMGNNYDTWAFRSLSDEPLPEVTASATYGGGERWSPDRRKVALVDVSDGRLTVLDFTDLASPTSTVWPIPRLIGAGWLAGSDGLAVARRLVTGAVEVQVRGLDGALQPAQQVDVGPAPGPDELEIIELVVSPDGRRVVLTGLGTPEAPGADGPLPVLADDGRLRVLGPLPGRPVAWSPRSDRVAWFDGTRVVIFDDDGRRTVEPSADIVVQLGWLAEDLLIVPFDDRALLLDPREPSKVTTIQDPGTKGMWAVAGDRLLRVAVADGVLRMRWYGADGTPDGSDLVLDDRADPDGPACLDIQPVDPAPPGAELVEPSAP
ncbi:MAG: hypothetical protein U0869_10675 [Chloroflexota bacterium]